MKPFLSLLAILSILLSGYTAQAKESTDWQTLNFPFYKPVEFSLTDDQISIVSESAASLFYRQFSTQEANKTHLSWSWKVAESSVPPTALNLSSGDDRIIGIYVFFSKKPVKRIDKDILRNGNYIGYLWGSQHAQGASVKSVDQQGRFFILRSHDTAHGSWYNEQLNFRKDFRQAFGYDGYPAAIAIAADTDDTKTNTIAFVKDVMLY